MVLSADAAQRDAKENPLKLNASWLVGIALWDFMDTVDTE